jgi:Fe2+ transport system protein B
VLLILTALRGGVLDPKSRIITVELAKLEYLLGVPVGKMNGTERWAFYFRYIRDKGKREKINEIIKYEEGIEMATEVLMTISRDEIEQARLRSELKYELDTQSRIAYAENRLRQAQEEVRQAQEKARHAQEDARHAQEEILKLVEAGFTAEQIKERLKAE